MFSMFWYYSHSVMLHDSYVCNIFRSNRWTMLNRWMMQKHADRHPGNEELRPNFLFCVVRHAQIWLTGNPV